jgi:hypothetical protein
MDWQYNGEKVNDLPDDCIGFVYLITNLTTGKMYIGKKLAMFAKTRYKTVVQKNGKKVKKRIKEKINSDWQTYYGSNDRLNQDVKTLGEEHFKREILYYCTSKAECSYIEAKEQFLRRVLETDDYYNGIISVRVGSSKALIESLKKYST